MKVNIRGLECFRETIAAGSVTAAARRLGLTQPAASRLLAQLEQQAGFTIFYRENGRLVPTVEARMLLMEVDVALTGLERVAILVDNIGNLRSGHLRIVGQPSFVEGALSRAVATFLQTYPDIHVSIDPRNVESALELVANRSADCGFCKLPVLHQGVQLEKIATCGTVCVLPNGHPLAARDAIGATDLRDEPLVLVGSKGKRTRVEIEAAFARANVPMRVRLETHTVGSACAFAGLGVGIAIVNELMARELVSRGQVLRPFRPVVLHEYAFMTASTAPMSRVTRAFLDHCLSHFGGERSAGP